MTTFENGPAHGGHASHSRAPVLLRVVIDQHGAIDVLDQVDDQPADDETISVYRLSEKPGVMFLDGTGPGGRRTGSVSVWAKYRYLPEQPTDAEIRETAAWRKWTTDFGKNHPEIFDYRLTRTDKPTQKEP